MINRSKAEHVIKVAGLEREFFNSVVMKDGVDASRFHSGQGRFIGVEAMVFDEPRSDERSNFLAIELVSATNVKNSAAKSRDFFSKPALLAIKGFCLVRTNGTAAALSVFAYAASVKQTSTSHRFLKIEKGCAFVVIDVDLLEFVFHAVKFRCRKVVTYARIEIDIVI
jgi:hypothetical protein